MHPKADSRNTGGNNPRGRNKDPAHEQSLPEGFFAKTCTDTSPMR